MQGPTLGTEETSGIPEHWRQSTFYKIYGSMGVCNGYCLSLDGGGDRKAKEQVRLETGRRYRWQLHSYSIHFVFKIHSFIQQK